LINLDKLSDDNGVVQKVDFDFLVDGELLRSPLDVHMSQKNISGERNVVIEYMEATPSPEPMDCLIHDDWVSAIHSKDSWYVV
jgi:ribosome biogenesis protein YTM1